MIVTLKASVRILKEVILVIALMVTLVMVAIAIILMNARLEAMTATQKMEFA